LITLLALPVQAAPLTQDAQATITSPADGQTVNGNVTISGSAIHADFDRFEISYGPDPNPNDTWQIFVNNNQMVAANTLGTWNTSVLVDGTYMIRLRVVRRDSNYTEAFVRGIKVSNQQPIGTPTSVPPAPTFGPEATLPAIAPIIIEQPPTNAPIVSSSTTSNTAANNSQRAAGGNGSASLGSLMGSACISGLVWTFAVFCLFGAIIFGRSQFKRFLRTQRKKLSDANTPSTPPSSA
ncbi:MAG TPA: hypothetical protein VFF70_04420, partial [Anaerolineae bacterium]|nr:hypothetical protein [Anaerolineae bacterium]